MSWVAPNEFEELSNVISRVELVVELSVGARLFDLYSSVDLGSADNVEA